MSQRQKELTKHLRTRIAKNGINARVRMLPASETGIQVFPSAYGLTFSETDQRAIRQIAKINNLTLVRGMEINVDLMTDPNGMEFHIS